jgi:hypothetical protein
MTIEEYKNGIKDYLRQGLIVVAPRQTGKTTALLELAKEFIDDGKPVAIQVMNQEHVGHLKRSWERLFGKSGMAPMIDANSEVVGLWQPGVIVLVDEISKVRNPHSFFAATDSECVIRRGFESRERAEHYGKLEPSKTGHVCVVMPMFFTD